MPNITEPNLAGTAEAAAAAFAFAYSKDGSVKTNLRGGLDADNAGNPVLKRVDGTVYSSIIAGADQRIWRVPVAFTIPGATTGVKTTLSLQNPFGENVVILDAILDLTTVKASGQIDIGIANANNGAASNLLSNQSTTTAGLFVGSRGVAWNASGNGSWLTFNVDTDAEGAAGTIILVAARRAATLS